MYAIRNRNCENFVQMNIMVVEEKRERGVRIWLAPTDNIMQLIIESMIESNKPFWIVFYLVALEPSN